jgi:hypothetical protein
MGLTLNKIDLNALITRREPALEQIFNASTWYVDEEMILDFGEYVGRPSANIMMHTNMLTYFFAYGWKVSAVLSSSEAGVWESVSETESEQSAEASNTTTAASSSSGNVESRSYSTGDQSATAKSETAQDGTSDTSGTATSSGSATMKVTEHGAPYWYAYQKIKLTRRRMDGELVLKDMVTSFTNAYNEGRTVNNARYDELVALYSIMLSQTEDEANAIPLNSINPEDLITLGDEIAAVLDEKKSIKLEEIRPIYDTAIVNIRTAIDALKNATSIPANWLKSRENDINRKFNAEKEKINATMIANGTYASSSWANVVSGIERDRQYALTDLSDTMVSLKVDTYGKIASLTADSEGRLMDAVSKLIGIETSLVDLKAHVADIRAKLMESAVRITEAIQKNRIGLTELRNTVLKWMFEFMERREDEYPGIEQLATVAERLGYGDGGAKPA